MTTSRTYRPQSRRSPDPWAPLLVLMSLYLASCSSDVGPARIAIQGTVRVGDVPLANGLIRFIPTGDTTGPAAVANIVDGAYTFSAEDGPIVGSHRVEIESSDKFEFEVDDEQSFAKFAEAGKTRDRKRPANAVPDIYNVRSKLSATVEPNGDPIFDFDLKPGPDVSLTNR